ncbi:ornithine cyclodeaminase family protein [Actinocrispum wychmicini]|uniref:Ornithine cyclodeaminase n=1 Tax=Actinocrispum wychmicini TaxID=1213861 RepID=A0A4R2JM40_9PSEU|nr:ornithine cyclodeaminase family protein [Actinocrispum wychmicini]TCO58176.1 ornithine cyclodeaminase [Actinocrispum wychmicini]
MRILSATDVAKALPMRDCVEVMAEALTARAVGEVEQPLRTAYSPPGADGRLTVWMPAYRGGARPLFGTKLLCLVPDNPSRGLDAHQGVTVLFDGVTGAPVAVLDASAVTAIRTAAVSALATRTLANPDASILAIIGAGVQAEAHLEAIPLVRGISEARVFSPRSAPALVDRMTVPFSLTATSSAEEAVRGADIVVTATTSNIPVIDFRWLKPGAHINAIGASVPSHREVDDATVAAAEVYADARESIAAEAADITPEQLRGELGEVLAGQAPGRGSARSLTLFRSLGIAAEDLFAADFAVRRAAELGLGVEAPM